MKLEFNDEQMRNIISAALLQAINPEQKTLLIEGAIQSLLSPSRDGYSRKNILQEAFDDAAGTYARRLIEEEFKTNTAFQAQVKELMLKVMERFFKEREEHVISKLADAMSHALTRDR
jgi:hypothetical protein